MCAQFLSGSTKVGPHLQLDAFREIAAKVFPHVAVWQPSVSGEPLLTEHFTEMLAIAADYGVQLDLTTSGTLWNDRLRDAVARALQRIQVSFDSSDPAVFESIRRGARFANVVDGIRALRERCRELRGDDMPRFGLSVTLMRRNVDGLPQLVEFAGRELGVDHLQVLHVHPVTDEIRAESLVHDLERARVRIDEAAARARELAIDLTVHPLDEVTARTALDSGSDRAVPADDAPPRLAGVVLEHPRPRAAAPIETAAAPADDQPTRTDLPDRLDYCHFLWERTYLALGGEVRPCCVIGAPVVGSIWNGDFDSVWNGSLYRELRRRMVAGDPAPVCRGCRGHEQTNDRARIARILGETDPPDAATLGPASAALDPRQPPPFAPRQEPPPTLRWAAVPDPRDLVLEISTDHFVTIVYSTASGNEPLPADGWQVPEKLWQQAPGDRTLFWRLVRRGDATPSPLATGRIVPSPTTAEIRSEPSAGAGCAARVDEATVAIDLDVVDAKGQFELG